MTQPEREPRDLGSPVTFGSFQSSFDVDFSPRPVSVDDIHPTEADADPKDLSAPEFAENFSDLIPELEDTATVVKESTESPTTDDTFAQATGEQSGEKVESSTTPTSPGEGKPPVVTPPLPPATTPSSRSGVKSS